MTRSFAEDQSKNPPPTSLLDRLTRRYSRSAYVIVVLIVYALIATVLGHALTPAIWWWRVVAERTVEWSFFGRSAALAFASAVAFFIFGFALLIVVPVFNLVLPTRVRPFNGGYYTLPAVPWLLHNALFYLVRFDMSITKTTSLGLRIMRERAEAIGAQFTISSEPGHGTCVEVEWIEKPNMKLSVFKK